ncbi:MAG: hypothetical protein LJE83_06345 [Gammaproteobacteria bacterium]|nr:hypothetical protein [Gammaproteobacteria bacterium]
MRILLTLVILIVVTTVNSAEKNYIREYTYKASDLDSRVTARSNAMKLIKAGVLEEIVTFVSSNSTIGQKQIGDEFRSSFIHQANSKSAGFLKAKILEETWNGYELKLKAEIRADPDKVRDELTKSLSMVSQDTKPEKKPAVTTVPTPAATPVPSPVPVQLSASPVVMPVNTVSQNNRGYIMVASFGQAYALISPIRMMTMQQYSMYGEWPTKLEQIGMSQDDTSDGQYIDNLRLGEKGEIVALLSKEFGDKRVLKISPKSVMGGMNIRWQCYTNLPVKQINSLSNFNCTHDKQLRF